MSDRALSVPARTRALPLPQTRAGWGIWLVNGLTIGLALLWSVPILWAVIASFRPPQDVLGRGDVWFSSQGISLESY